MFIQIVFYGPYSYLQHIFMSSLFIMYYFHSNSDMVHPHVETFPWKNCHTCLWRIKWALPTTVEQFCTSRQLLEMIIFKYNGVLNAALKLKGVQKIWNIILKIDECKRYSIRKWNQWLLRQWFVYCVAQF